MDTVVNVEESLKIFLIEETNNALENLRSGRKRHYSDEFIHAIYDKNINRIFELHESYPWLLKWNPLLMHMEKYFPNIKVRLPDNIDVYSPDDFMMINYWKNHIVSEYYLLRNLTNFLYDDNVNIRTITSNFLNHHHSIIDLVRVMEQEGINFEPWMKPLLNESCNILETRIKKLFQYYR